MTRVLILGAAVLCLASCSPKPNNSICAPIPTYPQDSVAQCVHYFAYRFAVSPDPAEAVARATAEGCRLVAKTEAQRSAWQNHYAGDIKPIKEREQIYLEINMQSAEKQALFRVIEARSGNCSPNK